MGRFADTLAAHPAPSRLGDVALRYEPSMLIGETPKAARSLAPTAAWVVGIAALVVALGLLLAGAPVAPIAVMVALGAVGAFASVWLDRLDRRQRRFVANFATTSLRLDFVTPFAGRPRTLVMPFDAVKALHLIEQGPGLACLTVDFVPPGAGAELLREVLVAFIPEAERAAAERLERVLSGAFGLGDVPVDSPLRAAEDAPPVDEFH
jgi:hypothetical protein